MNSLGEDISGVNWTVIQCHAGDFFAKMAAYTEQIHCKNLVLMLLKNL